MYQQIYCTSIIQFHFAKEFKETFGVMYALIFRNPHALLKLVEFAVTFSQSRNYTLFLFNDTSCLNLL